MARIIIRKQRAEHVRDGRPAKWCGAHPSCGQAAIATDHAELIDWADHHRCPPVQPASFGAITISPGSFERVPDDLWVTAQQHAQRQRDRIEGRGPM